MKEVLAQWIAFCARHRAGVALVLILLGLLAAGLTVTCGRFTNDVQKLFPATPEVAATFRILHDARLADAVQLEFVTSDDVTKHADFLSGAAERLRTRLRSSARLPAATTHDPSGSLCSPSRRSSSSE